MEIVQHSIIPLPSNFDEMIRLDSPLSHPYSIIIALSPGSCNITFTLSSSRYALQISLELVSSSSS